MASPSVIIRMNLRKQESPSMKKIALTAVVLMLSACGFHLKGSSAARVLPYQTWQVNGGEMQQAVEKALRRADGIPAAASRAQAAVTVTKVETRRDIYTITRAAEVNEYLLSLRVEAQVSRKGQSLGKPMTIVVNRTMNYANSEVLGKAEEEQTIWSEMRADAADQLVRRLTFLKAAN